ncbi:uncharacterized protein METZ01_LOCUS430792, partial [marine metagenome]
STSSCGQWPSGSRRSNSRLRSATRPSGTWPGRATIRSSARDRSSAPSRSSCSTRWPRGCSTATSSRATTFAPTWPMANWPSSL